MTTNHPYVLGRSLPELLTLEEAAAFARVGGTMMAGWIKGNKPEVASFCKGRNRTVHRDSLVEFIWLNSLRPRKPDWMTPQVESDAQRLMRELVAAEVAQAMANYESRITNVRKAA
jgi:hypothetical protein